MERKTYIYDGETFEEGELVLVNGEELMYCKYADKWGDWDVMYTIFAPRYKKVHRYEPYGDNLYATIFMRCTSNGDKIEHVYDPEPYNATLPPKQDEFVTNGYLIDGWIICIVLMVITLIFKPIGLWSLLVLCMWLYLKNEEIKRIKNMKK